MGDSLSPREWTVLLVVARTPHGTLDDIDQHPLVAPGSALPYLPHLHQLGLIATTPGQDLTYSPTPAGLATLRRILAACP